MAAGGPEPLHAGHVPATRAAAVHFIHKILFQWPQVDLSRYTLGTYLRTVLLLCVSFTKMYRKS